MPGALSASLFEIAPNVRPTPALRCCLIRSGAVEVEVPTTYSDPKRKFVVSVLGTSGGINDAIHKPDRRDNSG